MLKQSLLCVAMAFAGTVNAIDFTALDAPTLQQKIINKQVSAVELTQFYLDQIAKLDDAGPKLNAIIAINPEALKLAKKLDEELAAGKSRGPLHGLPVVLKDNIDTRAPLATTAGAKALQYNVKATAAPLVQQLEQAGAIIIGKANLSEWANFKSSFSSSGYSTLGGQTKNPHVLDRSPCGSSSGSAVAVAASLSLFAVGTETDGSIVCPASNNGIVGIKPTVGLISGEGIVPISHSQDTAGPMAKTVKGAALLLNSLVTKSSDSVDYTANLNQASLKGKRIGVTTHVAQFPAAVQNKFNEAVALMKSQGAIIVDGIELPEAETLRGAEFDILLYDFKHDLNAYLATTPKQVTVKSIEQLIAFNQQDTESLKYFDQFLVQEAANKGPRSDKSYLDAQATVEKYGRKEGIDKVMLENQLDALIAPTNTPAWSIDIVNGDNFSAASSSPAAIAGYPSVTVPMAFHKSLPLGISFFGRAYSEAKLIEVAYAFEQLSNARKAPQFIPTLTPQ
ncbi:amidase [Pseudoalteromonas sp. T1lg65]|uniref:amidase n=1 Tax=Pseudoalteromonas sp. T1lg65 TaxID=2077101 RepID=UPI003F7A8311